MTDDLKNNDKEQKLTAQEKGEISINKLADLPAAKRLEKMSQLLRILKAKQKLKEALKRSKENEKWDNYEKLAKEDSEEK
jgi:hypothetical protein